MYPKKSPKKKENLREHFERQWKQRVDSTEQPPFKLLNRAIQQQMTEYVKFLVALSNERTAHMIEWKSKKYTVIYNKKLNSVVTVYPFKESKAKTQPVN